MPKHKEKSDRQLLETIAREVAGHTKTLAGHTKTLVDHTKTLAGHTKTLSSIVAHIADHTVQLQDVRTQLTDQGERLEALTRNVDRFMSLHEKLDHELAAMRADLDRVKDAVRALGGKID